MRRNWGFMSLQNSSKVLKYGGCRLKILLGFFCFLNFFFLNLIIGYIKN